MAWLEIPIEVDGPNVTAQVSLDGVTYTLRLTWNERGSSWFMHLFNDADETPIRLGRRVLLGWPLFWRDLPGLITLDGDEMRAAVEDVKRNRIKYADASERA